MQFDLHALERRERVGDRVAVVRQGARVADDRRAPAPRPVDRVDQRTFVVRLHVLELVSGLRGGLAGELDEVVERRGAVVLGLALAEQVQVRAGKQKDRRSCGYH